MVALILFVQVWCVACAGGAAWLAQQLPLDDALQRAAVAAACFAGLAFAIWSLSAAWRLARRR